MTARTFRTGAAEIKINKFHVDEFNNFRERKRTPLTDTKMNIYFSTNLYFYSLCLSLACLQHKKRQPRTRKRTDRNRLALVGII